MTFMRLCLVTLGLVCTTASLQAQEKSPVKFGKVSPSDFVLPKTFEDSSADAVVIADIGNSEFVGSSKGWFTLVFKRTKRVKILNKNGFDAAKVSIRLYSQNGAEERLDKLRATTYNLENGKIVETKLDNNSIFKNVLSKHWSEKKFTFPAIKEGSIIEYSYTISSDYLQNLQPWEFQGEYPCMWSEYEVALPFFFNYVFLSQGYNPMYLNNTSSSFKSWTLSDNSGTSGPSDHYTITGDVSYRRWVMKDIKPLKEESFTSTLDNHISKIEFQLSEYRFPNMPVKEKMKSWVAINEEMMKDEDFGGTLDNGNYWLSDDLAKITKDSKDMMSKTQSIYSYVRDNFTCTNTYARYLSSPLKSIMKSKNGTVADINLLLCAMLRHEKIEANPVILSTRSRGLTHAFYPLMDRFNYVICQVIINDEIIYLDASTPETGFGKLDAKCYNGHARVLGTTCKPVYFYTDSLIEKKVTSVFIINDEKKPGQLSGNFSSTDGVMESVSIREKVKNKGQTAFFKEISSSIGDQMSIDNAGIDSVKRLEDPVNIHFDFNMNMEDDIIYYNPVMKEGYKENPFKSAERKYPVEMPCAINETYIMNMDIPTGYEVEEFPKSVKFSFNDGEGYFEYLIQKDSDKIQLRSRVIINKTNFMPEEYAPLRDFFGQVVKKHSEQIVFKKKKA